MTALAQSAYLTGRHLRFFLRQPWFIGISLVQPVIWLLLFGALFKNVVQIPGFTVGTSYIDYLVSGCAGDDRPFLVRLERHVDHRGPRSFDHGPAPGDADPPQRDHRGLNAYALVSFAIQALIIGGLAFILGARYPGGLLGYAVLTLCAMLVGAIVAAFSDAMALLLRQRESVIGINTLLTLPLTFLSAAFMPLALVPAWIATVATFNPVNWAVEGGREALTASPDWSFVLIRIALLVGLAALTTAWATRTFRAYQRSI